MNIIEEQNMNDETKQPLKGNSEAPNVIPSAKKVYSKPTLVVLFQTNETTTKYNPAANELTLHDPSGPISGAASS